MKLFAVALIFFLLGFAGLATGLLLRRKGLRGSCSSTSGTGHDCTCKTTTKTVMKITVVNRPSIAATPHDPNHKRKRTRETVATRTFFEP